MALAVMARLYGQDVADTIAVETEYDWHTDPNLDPFAANAGWFDGVCRTASYCHADVLVDLILYCNPATLLVMQAS